MWKNIKHYYLYFFSLIFSVTLYFSFQTLRFNEEVLVQLETSASASAGFEVATYLLYFIILVFVIYANHLFIKRRNKELGLYQLIGMTKGIIFRLVAIENAILFSGAVLIGIGLGFLSSQIFSVILMRMIGLKVMPGFSFSWEAVIVTLGIFGVMLLIVLIQLFLMIRRQSLLQMFQAANQSDESIRKFSWFHMLMGIIGLALIYYGYSESTVLFEGSGQTLVQRMLIVLFSTIFGTFLIFRYSVALLINLWRSKKKGFLSRADIIALMPIMYRMKSNASSLTLITVITAVSLGINTLSFISYYSIDKVTDNTIPSDFIITNEASNEALKAENELSAEEKRQLFEEALDQNGIAYNKEAYEYVVTNTDFRQLLANKEDGESIVYDIMSNTRLIAASTIGESLKSNEMIVKNFNTNTASVMEFSTGKYLTIPLIDKDVKVIRYDEKSLLANHFGISMYPVIIVADDIYEKVVAEKHKVNLEYHFNIADKDDLAFADELYIETGANVKRVMPDGLEEYQLSQYSFKQSQLQGYGLTMFVTAFLGLAFLVASGSILYFKQMSEAEMEIGSYTILRKIGYSEQDLMHGVFRKQLFNFGIPILVGLLHSYFAVKSGWWFFGSEYAAPMLIMMAIYVLLYIAFALLATNYYRKIIHRAL